MPYTVVIPSRNASNVTLSVASIRKHEPDAPIIVVDSSEGEDIASFCGRNDCMWLRTKTPFIYARAINDGIRIAPGDVILWNDDALLLTDGGLTAIAQAAEAHPEYGLLSARVHAPIFPETNPNGPVGENGIRDEPRMVAFVATYIPSGTIKAVAELDKTLPPEQQPIGGPGMLDERYTGYGCDDDDYCLRVRKAGLKIGVLASVEVNHGELPSTFRKGNGPGHFGPNAELFRQKWGHGLYGPDDHTRYVSIPKSTRLFIATPCFGGQNTAAFTAALLMTSHKLSEIGINHTWKPLAGDSLVQRARNNLVAKFLAGDWTHLMWIDADISWHPESIIRLLAATQSPDIEVACAVYPKKVLPLAFPCNVVARDGNKANVHPDTGFIEVKDAPTGFLLIRREVIERMVAAYPERKCIFAPEEGPEHQEHSYALFDCFIDEQGRHYLSEDFGFTRLYQRLGGHVWADPYTELEHFGMYRFKGRLIDALKAESATEAAKAA